MATQVSNIGPGDIAKASVSGGPNFALSTTEWLAIQTYVNDALALPITIDDLKKSLGTGAPSDMSDFNQLVAAYVNVHNHVTTWQNDTFPASVSLASDIYNYALQAPTYYNPILPLAQKLTANPDDQQSKDALAAILGVLSQKATQYHDNAASVAAKIQTFAEQTLADKTVLSGPEGKTGLQKYYNDKYGAASADVVALNEEVKAQKIILDAANAEYNHDVVVAATTPTYVWVWPAGTIAAAVVAGVYGKRAVDALDRAHAAQQKINDLNVQLASDAILLLAINSVESGITNILNPLNAALPIIQKIQGVWKAIADDLNNIIVTINTNIKEALPIIMNLGVETAITEWTAVGQKADAYRLNAYITIQQS